MKLRISGNSIRLRLEKPEVDVLSRDGELSETTAVGDAVFTYGLRVGAALGLDYRDGALIVELPESFVDEWSTTNLLGFEGEFGGTVVIVEKDMKKG